MQSGVSHALSAEGSVAVRGDAGTESLGRRGWCRGQAEVWGGESITGRGEPEQRLVLAMLCLRYRVVAGEAGAVRQGRL